MDKKIDRQLQIINELLDGKRLTCSHFSRQFGVSLKTIKKDIVDLSLHYPIETYTGRNGGIQISGAFTLNGRFMTREQLDLLQEALDILYDRTLDIRIQSIKNMLTYQKAKQTDGKPNFPS